MLMTVFLQVIIKSFKQSFFFFLLIAAYNIILLYR